MPSKHGPVFRVLYGWQGLRTGRVFEQTFANTETWQVLNDNSVPHPPSGKGHLDEVSLPPEAWSDLHRDSIGIVTRCSANSFWDKEHLDYAHPEEAPEPVDQAWLDHWMSWKRESDPYPPHSFEADPILADLLKANNAASPNVSSEEARFGELGFGVDTQDALGRTRLSFTAEDGDLVSAQLLIDKGADVEIADHDGHTPLLFAASNGHEAVVRLLLDGGAEVDAADNSRRTPLSWAASRSHDDVVGLLIEHSADIELSDPKYDRTPLSWAAARGHEATVMVLVDRGARIDSADLEHGRTPLSWAAEGGHEALVRILLERGADVETVDRDSRQTLLMFAAEHGHSQTVRILQEKGADLNAMDVQGWTALGWANDGGYDEVVRLLES